ncbi:MULTISPECIES: threonine synthase [Mycobacterium]|nr:MULTISPECIES: pyridoxal-phosphate dependent enzyme [Mycobacterium]MCF1814589.1 pyridoxal-phosphate dependent enzyme [Mycobacterium intracellulare subsp. intracellulare]MDM3898874.1 pyridoxal-phosphate dependent enzyme [Mycobacterium intracellulare]MDM3909084.1 pyridoxal-phosphate dependent enzyme [Mycobacterium intracellulare subsp. chimaera]MDM3929384.1 pyridoxal-phosphate dependent enzyme [Mycobacterium intracellulare subsp. chimaera]MDO2376097.1 pyridoxal-phosphate dependent enzyme [Myco
MNARYLGFLRCPRCGVQAPEDQASLGCPACARHGIGVNLAPAYALAPGPLPWQASQPGIFGFRGLLPLAPDDVPVSLGEGGTPLVSLRRLGTRLGLRRLMLKDEARNPTWSYKDRLAAVAVTKAAAFGASTVVVSSTGNHGAAVAAYAAAAGLGCVVLTVSSVPREIRILMQAYGACVVAYDNGPDRWAVMRAAVEAFGWMPVSGLVTPQIGSNPFGIQGYKTIAFELWRQLGETPDVVVVPTAHGDGLAGLRRGFSDLVGLGLISRMPRLVAVDPFGAYVGGLHREEGEQPTVATQPSMAFSVATRRATYQGLDAIRATNGTAIAEPSNDAIARMQLELASTEGIYAEGASVLAVLAAQQLAERRWIDPDESVVVLSTSTGLKDPGSSASHLPDLPVLEPTLTALEGALPKGMCR